MSSRKTDRVNLGTRHSLRLPGFDYTAPGAYFVTLVTQQRVPRFGQVVDSEMRLNAPGRMVQEVWTSLPQRFSGVTVDDVIVMPNHVHGIIVIGNAGATIVVARAGIDPAPANAGRPRTLGEIVGAFKSLVTRRYMDGVRTGSWPPFHVRLWQRNYHERVIRDQAQWDRIRLYIQANPRNWDEDQENIKNPRTQGRPLWSPGRG